MGKLGHEGEFLDFEIGEIGKLKHRWVLYLKFGNIKLFSTLKHKIFIKLVVKIGPRETVLEVVDKHDFESADIEPVQFVGLDFQVGRVLFLDRLELVCGDLLHQCVVNCVQLLLVVGDVLC
jgi:hypothetical protein